MPINYENIKESDIRSEFRANIGKNILETAAAGGTFGSAFGPWGTAIGTVGGAIVGGVGSVLGSKSLDRKIAEDRNNKFRINTVNESIAQSQAMNYNWNNRYTNTYDQVRVGAWAGLDALTQEGEIRGSMLTKDNKEIKGGIPNVDSKVEKNIRDDEYIIPKIYGLADMAMPAVKFLESLKNAVNKNKNPHDREIAWNSVKKSFNEAGEYVNSVAELTKELRNNGIIPKGDNDMPTHAAAGLDSVAVNGLSGLVGLGLFIGAYGQQVKNPNTYRLNPYAQQAFDTLDRINIPMLNVTNLFKDAWAKNISQIDNSGDLGSSLKMAGKLAASSNHYSNIADTMFKYYNQLNDIKTKTALLKLGEGQHAALMMLNAAQWDLDYYSKAHAARQDMINMGIVNTIGSLRDIVKNADRNRMFNLMEKMYVDNGEGAEQVKYDNPFNTKKANTSSLASISNANPSSNATRLLGLTKRKNTLGIKSPTLSIPQIPTNIDDLYLKVANDATDRLYKRLFR